MGELIGGDFWSRRRLRWFWGTVRWQACVSNLVEQGPVADVQRARGSLAIPVVILEDFEDHLTLQFANGLAGQLLE